MGLSNEILKKPALETKSLKGLNGAGLGMAGTFVLHSRLATALCHSIQPDLDDNDRGYYEAVVEARGKAGAKARIYDVCIKLFYGDIYKDWGRNIVIIEIVNSGTDNKKAHDRIMETFNDPEESSLCEAFIYDYNSKLWTGYHKTKTGKIIVFDNPDDKETYTCTNFDINLKSKVEQYLLKLQIYGNWEQSRH